MSTNFGGAPGAGGIDEQANSTGGPGQFSSSFQNQYGDPNNNLQNIKDS